MVRICCERASSATGQARDGLSAILNCCSYRGINFARDVDLEKLRMTAQGILALAHPGLGREISLRVEVVTLAKFGEKVAGSWSALMPRR